MDPRNAHLECDFVACDRTAIMGHSEGCDKHPSYVPPAQGTNSRNPDETDSDDDDDEDMVAPAAPAAPAPAAPTYRRNTARNRAGPTNQQPKVKNSQKFYPARASHNPEHLVVLKNGKFYKLESFPGWGFHDVRMAAERGCATYARDPNREWEDSGRPASRGDFATGALVASVPAEESFGERIRVQSFAQAARAPALRAAPPPQLSADTPMADAIDESRGRSPSRSLGNTPPRARSASPAKSHVSLQSGLSESVYAASEAPFAGFDEVPEHGADDLARMMDEGEVRNDARHSEVKQMVRMLMRRIKELEETVGAKVEWSEGRVLKRIDQLEDKMRWVETHRSGESTPASTQHTEASREPTPEESNPPAGPLFPRAQHHMRSPHNPQHLQAQHPQAQTRASPPLSAPPGFFSPAPRGAATPGPPDIDTSPPALTPAVPPAAPSTYSPEVGYEYEDMAAYEEEEVSGPPPPTHCAPIPTPAPAHAPAHTLPTGTSQIDSRQCSMENAPAACTADRPGTSASIHAHTQEDAEVTAQAEKGNDSGRIANGGRRTPKPRGRLMGLTDTKADTPWKHARAPGRQGLGYNGGKPQAQERKPQAQDSQIEKQRKEAEKRGMEKEIALKARERRHLRQASPGTPETIIPTPEREAARDPLRVRDEFMKRHGIDQAAAERAEINLEFLLEYQRKMRSIHMDLWRPLMEAEMIRRLNLTPLTPFTPNATLQDRGLPAHTPVGPRPNSGSNATPIRPRLGDSRIKHTNMVKGDGLVTLVWPGIKPRKSQPPAEQIAEEVGDALGLDAYQGEWLGRSDGREALAFQVEKEKLRELNTRFPLKAGKTPGWVLAHLPLKGTPAEEANTRPPTSAPPQRSPPTAPSPKNRNKGKGRKVTFTPTPPPAHPGCSFCGSQSHAEPQCTQRLLRMASIRQQRRREEEDGWAPASENAGMSHTCTFCAQDGHGEFECELLELMRGIAHEENGVKFPRPNH